MASLRSRERPITPRRFPRGFGVNLKLVRALPARQREMSGPGGQARSSLARCGVHCRPDGSTRAVHRRRAGSGCRSVYAAIAHALVATAEQDLNAVFRRRARRRCRPVHVASVCHSGREGEAADFGVHTNRSRRSQVCAADILASLLGPASADMERIGTALAGRKERKLGNPQTLVLHQ
jgi:hypothetical protein